MKNLPLIELERMAMHAVSLRARALGAPVGMHQPRRCGACTACCTALGIEYSNGEEELGLVRVGLDKSPAGTPCPHECADGCGVYTRRPMSCRGYACWWVRGWGADRDRPNRSGLIVDDSLDAAAIDIGTPVCCVTEVRAGVLGPRGCELSAHPKIVRELARDRLVLLRYVGDDHPSMAHGSPARMRMLRDAERRMGYRA